MTRASPGGVRRTGVGAPPGTWRPAEAHPRRGASRRRASAARLAWRGAQPPGLRDLALPPPARRQPRRLVGVGAGSVRGSPASRRTGTAERRVRRVPLVPRGSRVDGCRRKSTKPQVSGLVVVRAESASVAVGHRFRGFVHHSRASLGLVCWACSRAVVAAAQSTRSCSRRTRRPSRSVTRSV